MSFSPLPQASLEDVFSKACSERRIDVLQFMLECGVSLTTLMQTSSVAASAVFGGPHLDVLDWVLEHTGFDVNMETAYTGPTTTITKSTALTVSARAGWVEGVRRLLSAGADVNQAANNDFTPLFIASQEGHLHVVLTLIGVGGTNVDVNQADNDGATPLYIASWSGHGEVVSTLIVAGAEVNQATIDGVTPLYIASQGGHMDVVSALICAGAEVNQATIDGVTPLYIASEKGHRDVVSALICAGAEVNQAAIDGVTPLYIASEKGHRDVVLTLIGAGGTNVDVNQADNDGWTPLHAACYYKNTGSLGCVALLLQAGANPLIETKDGSTCLRFAIYQQRPDIIAVLSAFSSKFLAEIPFNNFQAAIMKALSDMLLADKSTWETIVVECSRKRIGARLLSWVTNRVYSGLPLSWETNVSAKDVLDTVRRMADAIVVDRLYGLHLFSTAWNAGNGKCATSEHPLCTMISLRRVCRNVDGHHLVEPFGQAVIAFL